MTAWCLFAAAALVACPYPSPARQPAEPASIGDAIGGPRELLGMLGVTDASWETWNDDRALSPSELNRLVETVFFLSRFHPADWDLWRRPAADFNVISEEIEQYRGEIVGFAGRVMSYSRLDVSRELLDRYELDELFTVRVSVRQADGVQSTVEFVVPRLPDSWQVGSAVGQPVEVVGICLKRLAWTDDRGHGGGGTRGLLLVGPRVRWFPDRPAVKLGVHADQLDLVQAGFGFELLDDARRANGRDLGQTDRECFYQMLQATGKMEPHGRFVPSVDSLIPLLRDSEQWIGRPVRLRGTTRRIAKVMVLDARDRRRLGFDHYYQIDLFIDLEGARIEIQPPATDNDRAGTEPVVLTNVYPVTVCCLELPAGLRDALGGNPSASVRLPYEVDGYLMKLWAYYSPLVARFGGESRQKVPLVIARQLQPLAGSAPAPTGLWFALLFIAGLGAAWIWVWRTGKADRSARHRLTQRVSGPPPTLDQDSLESSSSDI